MKEFRGHPIQDNAYILEGMEDATLEEWTVVGFILGHITKACEDEIIDHDQVIVWSQNQVLRMTPERYNKGPKKFLYKKDGVFRHEVVE